jgi:hypothetical protein
MSYGYSELRVPEGEDPPGSYFMAHGFGEGSFGIQVKSAAERWILFSVWSPFHTDDPKSVPQEDRVVMVRKGEDVQDRSFGGEGSGGQSVLVFPWKAGVNYKFLTSVKPDEKGNTLYTAWFGEAGKEPWRLIASFKRPKTTKHLHGFHSFLENFHDRDGFRHRKAYHGNQWACDVDGQWHELTTASFTVDATGGGGHRLDFAGGVEQGSFYMRNGGFFSEHIPAKQKFTRPAKPGGQPKLDFDQL